MNDSKRDQSEGWESLEEDVEGGALAPNPELEEAMKEAMEAVEARHGEGERPAPAPLPASGAPSEDVAGLQDRLLRLQADFENFRKRTLKEREEAYLYGSENLVKDLLPTVDNLERAIEAVGSSGATELQGLLQGVELVLRELRAVLEKNGVQRIEAEQQTFDPAVHEAMAQVPDGSVPPNTVVQVYEHGYRLRERLLRPSRVVVSRAPEGENEA